MCLTPITLKRETMNDDSVSVPCGRCPVCLKRRADGWAFRLMQEDTRSNNSVFLTLTYNTDHVPLSARGFMNLNKRDVQLFLKRLRKLAGRSYNVVTPIRYYVCGEYGSRFFRPHYHAIIFNCPSPNLVMRAWMLDNKPIGDVHFGQVSGASVMYTLKYMCKEKRIPLHSNDDRLPEFALMSKRLGASYLSEEICNWHHADMLNRLHLTLKDGRKIAMPRYYKDKLFTEYDKELIALYWRDKHSDSGEADLRRVMEELLINRYDAATHLAQVDQNRFQQYFRDAKRRCDF